MGIHAGDTIPLQTFVDFAKDANVVLHESVGPVFDFNSANIQSQNIYLNHTTQAQVGSVFQALKVRGSPPIPSTVPKVSGPCFQPGSSPGCVHIPQLLISTQACNYSLVSDVKGLAETSWGHLQGPNLRLAIVTHLALNDMSYVPLLSATRQTYPDGPLALAKVRLLTCCPGHYVVLDSFPSCMLSVVFGNGV